MQSLDKIFTKEDVGLLLEYACGKKVKFTAEVHDFDRDKLDECTDSAQALFYMDHNCSSELVISFSEEDGADPKDKGYFPNFQVVIRSTGDVSYKNFGGCRFAFEHPLKAYELILACFYMAGIEPGDLDETNN